MAFGNNDKRNARNNLVVGPNLMAFGHNDKKTVHSKLVIQHNKVMKGVVACYNYGWQNDMMYAPNNHTTGHNIMIFAQNGMM